MAPSTTIGAIILLWRRAATKVIVSQFPSGTMPITRTPDAALPLSRAMLVLTAVSSINTSRAGSRKPCSRIQRRRARATSARWRSAACRLFFKGDVVSIEKTPKRATAGLDPFQRRDAPAAGFRRGAPLLIPALQPFYRRRHAHLEIFGGFMARRTRLDGLDHAFPQVTRIGLRHLSPP